MLENLRRRANRAAYRQLIPFQVNLRRYELQRGIAWVVEELPGVHVWHGGYDAELGLTADNVDHLLIV
jgi:hypothetical protein